jgi:hypothetical protein
MNSLIVDHARLAFLPLCVSVSLWFASKKLHCSKNVDRQNPLLRCKTYLLIATSPEAARQSAIPGFATPPTEFRQTQETKKPLRGSAATVFDLCKQVLRPGERQVAGSDELFASSNQGAKSFGQ